MRNGAAKGRCEGGLHPEVVVMDDMEEYTVNDDLRACGLPADDDDDLTAGAEALFGSSVAPINVDAPDDAGTGAGGDGVGDCLDAYCFYCQQHHAEACQVWCLERLRADL